MTAIVHQPAGPKRGLLRAVGLEPDTPLLVLAATLTGDLPQGVTVRDATADVTRDRRGLAVGRQDEIVGIMPLPPGGVPAAVTGLRRSWTDLARRGVRPAVGVSTVHAGLGEVPEAYAEAQAARDGLSGSPGVLAMSALHLLVLPLFHSFGQIVQMNAGFAARATLVLLPRFDAVTVLELMQAEQVTFFAGVPTMYHALLNCEETGRFDIEKIAARLGVAVFGGAALPVEVMRRFEERFGVPILEGYGLSETSPVATFNRVDRPRRPGSVGLPVWGVEVRIVRDDGSHAGAGEPGEIAIRSHNVMKGYFRRPDATAGAIDRDGWFRTGDIGTRDADGYLYVVDRKKDMIIRGGFNVYPREPEEVLLTHPEVSLAAVAGVPHPSHGEEVKTFVVRAPGAELTAADPVAWCQQNMAAYKYPRIVEFRDSLPMTATGKILKRELARPEQAEPALTQSRS